MQEGLLSLMQMAKTTAALTQLARPRLPFISVLTDPTMGGVSASFAMLGDVVIAEPKALIGFAGPRVIEQTVRETLPEGFQRAEFLLEKGAIDMIVDRREMRERLAQLLAMLQDLPAEQADLTAPTDRALGDAARTLAEWLAYIERLHPASIELGLERVDGGASERLGAAAAVPGDHRRRHQRQGIDLRHARGDPARAPATASACYTSPHLLRYNERVRVDGAKASDAALCDAFAAVEAARGRACR